MGEGWGVAETGGGEGGGEGGEGGGEGGGGGEGWDEGEILVVVLGWGVRRHLWK